MSRKPAQAATVIGLSMLGILQGCGGISRDQIVKAPDAPMIINSVRGSAVSVSVFDAVDNKIIDYGWIRLDDQYEGWTISKFDWESLIEQRSKQR